METLCQITLRIETYFLVGQKPASRFNAHHREGGNLMSNYSKDRSLLLGLILITEQVETLCQIIPRTETYFSVRFSSSSRWKPCVKLFQEQKPASRFDSHHRVGGNLISKIINCPQTLLCISGTWGSHRITGWIKTDLSVPIPTIGR